MIYLTPEAAGELAADFAEPATFQSWIVDIASPGLLRMLRKTHGFAVERSGGRFNLRRRKDQLSSSDYGWKPVEVQSLLKNAARLKRLSFVLRVFALLPENEEIASRIGHGPASASSQTKRLHSAQRLYAVRPSRNTPCRFRTTDFDFPEFAASMKAIACSRLTALLRPAPGTWPQLPSSAPTRALPAPVAFCQRA